MSFFNIATAAIYLLLALIWASILVLYGRHLRRHDTASHAISIMLLILVLDAARSLFESLYFGARHSAKFGLLPEAWSSWLDRPEIVFIPTLVHLLVASAVLLVFVRRGLPALVRDSAQQQARMQQLEFERRAREWSERRYQALLDMQSRLICRYQPDGALSFVNTAFADYFQQPVATWIGRSFLSLVSTQHEQPLSQGWAELVPGQADNSIELQVRLPDGSERWLCWTERAIWDQGRILEIQSMGHDISDAVKARVVLQQSEENFRLLTESIDDVFWLATPGLERMLYVSPNYPKICGRSQQSALEDPQAFVDSLHPEDRARVLAELESVGVAPWEHEYRIVREDLGVRWIQERGFPIFDKAGKLYRMAGVVRDITAEKQNLSALRDSEARYRTLFQGLAGGMVTMSNDGLILSANPALCKMLNYAEAELKQLSIVELAHPDDRKKSRDLIESCLRGERSTFVVEKRCLRRDQSELWVLASVAWVRDEQQRPQYGVAIVQDIGEVKRAERMLRNKSTELETLLDTIPAPVFFQDQQGRFQIVNNAFAAVVGKPVGAIIGRRCDELMDASGVDAMVAMSQKVLSSGDPVSDWTHQICGANNQPAWFSTYMAPLRGQHNQISGLLGLCVDVTERVVSSQARISELERQRDTLVREVHHRIKNHLQGMIGLLEEYAHTGAETQPIVEAISSQIQAIAAVHGLQSQSKGGPLGVLSLLEQIIQSLHRKDVIALSVAGDAKNAVLDEQNAVSIALILNEMLTNAIKHGVLSVEPATPAIRVGIAGDSDRVTITIRNRTDQPDYGNTMLNPGRQEGGAGLQLMHALLPGRGAKLETRRDGEHVVAELELEMPVLSSATGINRGDKISGPHSS